MDDMLMESLAGFDSLWQRVTSREAGPARETAQPERPRDAQDTLPLLIREEAAAAAGAAALARMCQADGRAVLLRHAAEARRHLRRLRAEYFILTGLTVGGSDTRRPSGGRLVSLRDAYMQAGAMAARYAQAGGETESPELAEVFAAFAADERRRARELRALLVESF